MSVGAEEKVCPQCGQGPPNRPEIVDAAGWWWRCFTEGCSVSYWNPVTGQIREKSLDRAKTEARARRAMWGFAICAAAVLLASLLYA